MASLLKKLEVGKFEVKSPKEYTPEELLEFYFRLRVTVENGKSSWSTEAFCNDLQDEILNKLKE